MVAAQTQLRKFIEGVVADDLRTGVVVMDVELRPAGFEMEPSGHVFQQVTRHVEAWFHPYSGAKPVECSEPAGRRCRILRKKEY